MATEGTSIDGASEMLKKLDLVDGASKTLKELIAFVDNEINQARGVDDELKKLKQTLMLIQAKTLDAEKKQVNDVEVSLWLKGLKEAASDAYDVLYEFSYEGMDQILPTISKDSNQVALLLLKLAHKVKNITKKLDQIATDMDRFQFQTIGGPYEQQNKQIEDLNYFQVLVIRNLEKVGGIEDVKRANKQNVQLLELYWDGEGVHDSSMVLEGLQPHPNLKILLIKGFEGLKLPKWMNGSNCLPNLVELKLLNCNSCEQLPSLGLLPCLKVLHMDGMNSVKRLGEEFYYQERREEDVSIRKLQVTKLVSVFRSLVELRLKDMSSLDEWLPPSPRYCYNSFLSLRYLIISGCFQLKSIPLTSFSSVDCFELSNTSDKIVSSILANKEGRVPITSLCIQDSPQVKFFPVWVLQHYGNLRSLEISCCSKFQGFHIQNYEDDGSSDIIFNYSIINSLYSLKLRNCPALTYLPDLQEWKSLTELWIENCDKLKKFLSNYDLTSLSGLQTLYVDSFIDLKDSSVRPPSTTTTTTTTTRLITMSPSLEPNWYGQVRKNASVYKGSTPSHTVAPVRKACRLESQLTPCSVLERPTPHSAERTVKMLKLSKAQTVPESLTIQEACRRMAARRVGALLLTDSNGLLCGILTDKDIATRVVARELNLMETPISKVMTRNPVFVLSDILAVEALQRMVEGKFRHLPVVEKGEVIALLRIENCLNDAIRRLERAEEKENTIAAAVEGTEKHQTASVSGPNTYIERMFKSSLSTIIQENSKIVTVSPTDTVLSAAKKMLEHKLSCLLITVDDKPRGILTSKDILMRVIAQSLSPDTTLVEKVMTPNPECATVDTPIVDALHTMHDGKFFRLPVVGRDGKIVSVIDVIHITLGAVATVGYNGGNDMMQKYLDSAKMLGLFEDDEDSQSEGSLILHSEVTELGRSSSVFPSPSMPNMFGFKIQDIKGRMHRFYCNTSSLAELKTSILQRLGDDSDPTQLPQILYEDEDHDKVMIASDSDLAAAVDHAKQVGWKGLRLHLDYSGGGSFDHAHDYSLANAYSTVVVGVALVAGLGVLAYLKREGS